MSLGFAAPIWLALLVLLPAWWLWLRPRRSEGFVVATAEVDRGASPGLRPLSLLDPLPSALRTVCVGCVVVALAQPQLVRVFEEPVTEGVGIAFAIDLSTSMWAEDMARGTSRLDAAKSTVRRFLETRTDDVALVSFAGESLTRMPLTHDGYVVDAAVAELEVGLLIDGRFSIGRSNVRLWLLADIPTLCDLGLLCPHLRHRPQSRAGLLVNFTIGERSNGLSDLCSALWDRCNHHFGRDLLSD